MTKRQRRTNVNSVLIGVVTTAAVMLAHVAGVLKWLEDRTLDLRFRYTNSIKADPRIICVDIDDDALEVVGRWPWSRVSQAPLISILAELGAKTILVDLNWSEQEPLGTVTRADIDVLADPLQLGPEDAEQTLPDHELWTALHDARNVYLAFERPVRDPERSDEFNAAVDALLRDEPDDDEAHRQLQALAERRRRQTRARLDEADRGLFNRARFVAALERDPTLTAVQLAGRLEVSLDDFLDRARIVALERRCRRWVDKQPARWQAEPWELFRPLYRALTGREVAGDSPFQRALSIALRNVLSYEATTRAALVPPERVRAVAEQIDGITPVYYKHARAARRCGFVSFEPDLDGIVRRVPLLARHGERVLAQIAFVLGCDELGVPPDGFVVSGRELQLWTPGSPQPILKIQLDERGRALIPWVPGREWIKTFKHLPADAIWSLHVNRVAVKHNRERVREALWTILSDKRFAELSHERQIIENLFELEAQIEKERYRGNSGDVQELVILRDGLEAEVERIEALVRARDGQLRQERVGPSGASHGSAGDDPAPVEEMLPLIDSCRRANAKLKNDIEETAARIREIVENKICLIGYTASSLPDMKPIPTSESAAGVMAHANLLNGMLRGRMVGEAPMGANLAFTAAFGLLVTLLSTFMRPRLMALLVVFFAASYVAIAGAIAFVNYTYWFALTPAVAAMVVPFVGIAVYRYVFIDSERRQLSTALGQYTSKEIARQVAENPELCQRAEMREVTAVFTDLKGFTPISERIGAQRTQEVLNACLGRFTDIMLRHEGMVNKFMGDGVFVFWNPVIYPQEDHAMRACTTAVDLLTGLEELKIEQRRAGGDVVFDELVLRIGIATGNAIVGPCGSEQKFDYTCIGDSVNVASRLEAANKFYGTQILISHATREQVGDAFEFRPLGGVRVKGKREAVPIYELLGRTGEVPDDVLADASAFGQAVAFFQQRRWRDALEAFNVCQDRRPDDLAAHNYIEATASLMMNPPDDRWTGAIELTEK